MMKIPRIFVGTMYAGEEEFEESRYLVGKQQEVLVDHFFIKNLPEYEAHGELWKTWESAKNDYDLFIKVDADTLIDDPRMFEKIYTHFKSEPRLTGMQIPLFDYFTNGLIAGLNCFSPVVKFRNANSRLHADHADTNHDITMKGDKVSHLAPAGRHCAYPNKRQAFHYGLHRMKKNQVETMRNVFNAWQSLGGEGRLFALYGAECAITQRVDHDYNTESFETAFRSDMQNPHDYSRIESMIKRLGAF